MMPVRHLALLALVAAWANAGCTRSPRHRATGAVPPANASGPRDTAAALVELLREALRADSAAAEAWPGFRLGAQVLFVAVQPGGPVAMAGDSAPPPEYELADARRRIFLRGGPPPDSLSGLRIALEWKGAPAAGTAISYFGERTLRTLVHEAFHTFQRRVRREQPGTFRSGATPTLSDTATEAIALLNLEGYFLVRALEASDVAAARQYAETALAVRAERCALLGEGECQAERDVEQNEGTATYVAALIADGRSEGARRQLRDSLGRMLPVVRDIGRLRRFQFYDTGLAWLLLLERLSPADWKHRVERTPPDLVLAEHLGVDPARARLVSGAARRGATWDTARAEAVRFARAEAARRDSLERAFWAQPGVLVRVYWQSHGSVSSERRRSPSGGEETVIRFGKGANWILLRGQFKDDCCPGVYYTKSPVAGRRALVGGVPAPLDQAGVEGLGAVALDLPTVSLAFERGQLRVYADSVTVRMR